MDDNKLPEGKLRNMTAIYLRCGDGMVLLYRMGSRVVGNCYTGTAGGHFEKEELNDARGCVLRELYEETGLKEQDMENLALRYVTLRLKNGEIRQNYYFFADLKEEICRKWGLAQESSQRIQLDFHKSTEGRLEWIPNDRLLELEMPASAKFMMQHYLAVGKDTTALYGGVTTAEGIEFVELKEFSD